MNRLFAMDNIMDSEQGILKIYGAYHFSIKPFIGYLNCAGEKLYRLNRKILFTPGSITRFLDKMNRWIYLIACTISQMMRPVYKMKRRADKMNRSLVKMEPAIDKMKCAADKMKPTTNKMKPAVDKMNCRKGKTGSAIHKIDSRLHKMKRYFHFINSGFHKINSTISIIKPLFCSKNKLFGFSIEYIIKRKQIDRVPYSLPK
jgi:hypothetical protein